MIELIGKFNCELMGEPADRLLYDGLDTFFVEDIPLNNRYQWTHLSFKVNDQRQGHCKDEFENKNVLELSVRVVLLLLVQMADVVVDENMQELGHCDNKN